MTFSPTDDRLTPEEGSGIEGSDMKLILTNDELEKELSKDSLHDLLRKDNSVIHKGQGPSEGEGRGKNLPDLKKEMIALESNFLGLKQNEIAKIHGVSNTSVNHLSRGEIDTKGTSDPELQGKIYSVKNRIENIATAKLLSTLDAYQVSGMDNLELVTAAQKLAGIVEKIGPRDNKNQPLVELHLYGPRQNEETDYPVINVR